MITPHELEELKLVADKWGQVSWEQREWIRALIDVYERLQKLGRLSTFESDLERLVELEEEVERDHHFFK